MLGGQKFSGSRPLDALLPLLMETTMLFIHSIAEYFGALPSLSF